MNREFAVSAFAKSSKELMLRIASK